MTKSDSIGLSRWPNHMHVPKLEPDPEFTCHATKSKVKQEPFSTDKAVKKEFTTIQKDRQVDLKQNSPGARWDVVVSYFPSPFSIVKLCFLFTCIFTTYGICTKIILPTINLPLAINQKLLDLGESISNTFSFGEFDVSWGSISGAFRPPVPKTDISKLKASLTEIQSLDTHSLASLSTSLHEASSVLSDIPLTAADFPDKAVRKEVEEFREQLRGLSSDLRKSYHSTWKVFLRSKSFMERGHRFIYLILKATDAGKYQNALTWLKKLQDEVLGLQQQHVDANEALDKAYHQVNILSSEAKRRSLSHLEISEALSQPWSLQTRALLYSLGILGHLVAGPMGAVATECAVGLYHLVDSDNSKIKASKHAQVGESFKCAYTTLDQTREIINKDILVLGEISQFLEDLLLDAQDVGIAIEEPDLRDDLQDLCDQTRDKFGQLQEEYERIMNAPRINQMQIAEGSKEEL